MTGILGPGSFVAVVGASGVGKDSLIGYASERLGPLVTVPRRVVTRPAGPGEDHLPVTEDEFLRGLAQGRYACHWRAHGLAYGLPISVDETVLAGGIVLTNVSRSVLADLERRYARFRVVLVTASMPVRAKRLALRGRESQEEVTHRLAHPDPAPGHRVDTELVNDERLPVAGERLTAYLRGLMAIR